MAATLDSRGVPHPAPRPMTAEEKKVIFASSLGTVFEWYDFYLYAVLAPFFAALFFPPGNATAALLSAFATYAAGFPSVSRADVAHFMVRTLGSAQWSRQRVIVSA